VKGALDEAMGRLCRRALVERSGNPAGHRAAPGAGELVIRMASLMADNAAFWYREISRYLARRTGLRMQVVENVPWQERERMLDRGEVQLAFICGLPYVRKVDRPPARIELLAAPVMGSARYQRQPIYFSDVVVRRDSPFRSFADLRGASWAYNEQGSQSGYNLIRCHLAQLGELSGYFGDVIEAGAHQTSLRMVLDGRVDASAIDSIVRELELKLHPELALELRIIETLGPSPIPPAVISTRVPAATRQSLREALLRMHEDDEGRRVLDAGMAARFVEIADGAYDEIRAMAIKAEPVRL
jgi:phosphonate transport system substrate-binding protein